MSEQEVVVEVVELFELSLVLLEDDPPFDEGVAVGAVSPLTVIFSGAREEASRLLVVESASATIEELSIIIAPVPPDLALRLIVATETFPLATVSWPEAA